MAPRRPCAACGRPTALAALVETHLPAPPSPNPRVLLAADWVVWLCPACVRRGIRIPRSHVERR